MEMSEAEFAQKWEKETTAIKQVMDEYRAMAELVKDSAFIELAKESQRLNAQHEDEWSRLGAKYFREKFKASDYVKDLIVKQRGHSEDAKVENAVALELWRAEIEKERKTGNLGKIEVAQQENFRALEKLLDSRGVHIHFTVYDELKLDPAYWIITVDHFQKELDKLGTKEKYVKREMRKRKTRELKNNAGSKARTIVEELQKGD